MYHITTTYNKDVDKLIQEGLKQYFKNELSAKEVISILASSESYDDDGRALYPDTDMTKEVKYDVIEVMSKISGVSEDDLWDIYDEVYSDFYSGLYD